MTTLKERFEEKFESKTYDSYQGWTYQDLDELISFFRQELLALAEEVEGSLLPLSDNLGIEAHNRATKDAAIVIRSKADEFV